MRVHLAAEHSPEFQLRDFRLDTAKIGNDVVERRLVVIFGGKRVELARILDAAAEPVQGPDEALERRALPAEPLCSSLILPNARILELALNFL
jgi:hypothetical protein